MKNSIINRLAFSKRVARALPLAMSCVINKAVIQKIIRTPFHRKKDGLIGCLCGESKEWHQSNVHYNLGLLLN